MNSAWMLTVEHRFGVDVTLYTSEAAAKTGLYEYVRTWWDEVLDEKDIPIDHDEAISRYFEAQLESPEFPETYWINEELIRS